jgi:hypothetical protein
MNWREFLSEVVAPLMVCFCLFIGGQSPCDNGAGLSEPAPQNTNPAWDTDGDGISNAVELNDANDFHNFDTSLVDTDPSIARGLPDNGWIDCAINLVDTYPGYCHYLSTDNVDTDDWGVLTMINMIEGAGRDWYNAGEPPPLINVGDISTGNPSTQQFGGYWIGHSWHQNGLDLDVRYCRKDGANSRLNIADTPQEYDMDGTIRLMNTLFDNSDFKLIVVSPYCGLIFEGIEVRIDTLNNHNDHFHAQIEDPDGLDNKLRLTQNGTRKGR